MKTKLTLFILLLAGNLFSQTTITDLQIKDVKISINFSLITQYTGDTTVAINIYQIDSTQQIHGSRVKIDTLFAASGLTEVATDLTYTTAEVTLTAPIDTTNLHGHFIEWVDDGSGSQPPGNNVSSNSKAVVVSLRITLTGAHFDNLTAGNIEVHLFISSLTQ